MVRSTIAGTKTQTRRVVRWRDLDKGLSLDFTGLRAFSYAQGWVLESPSRTSSEWRCKPTPCPYGKVGDRLWVREPWRVDASLDRFNGTQIADRALAAGFPKPWAPIQYEADGARDNWVHKFSGVDTAPGRLRLARFMPRWASRITLEVTDVRVERLRDISVADCISEGIGFDVRLGGHCLPDGSHFHATDPRMSFWSLWEAINGPFSVVANPLVWAISFRRMHEAELRKAA